tara:strand:+ start:110 stop:664 length:555 start_codon:yes stop_codon:yes gene_type:complete
MELARFHHQAEVSRLGAPLLEHATQAVREIHDHFTSQAQRESEKVTSIRVGTNFHSTPDKVIIERDRKEREKEALEEAKRQEKEQREREKEEARLDRIHQQEELKRKRVEDAEEKAAKKRKEKEEKEERREMFLCRGKCGVSCRSGKDWLGCDYCDGFWVCGSCLKIPSNRGKLTRHENNCQLK